MMSPREEEDVLVKLARKKHLLLPDKSRFPGWDFSRAAALEFPTGSHVVGGGWKMPFMFSRVVQEIWVQSQWKVICGRCHFYGKM